MRGRRWLGAKAVGSMGRDSRARWVQRMVRRWCDLERRHPMKKVTSRKSTKGVQKISADAPSSNPKPSAPPLALPSGARSEARPWKERVAWMKVHDQLAYGCCLLLRRNARRLLGPSRARSAPAGKRKCGSGQASQKTFRSGKSDAADSRAPRNIRPNQKGK